MLKNNTKHGKMVFVYLLGVIRFSVYFFALNVLGIKMGFNDDVLLHALKHGSAKIDTEARNEAVEEENLYEDFYQINHTKLIP